MINPRVSQCASEMVEPFDMSAKAKTVTRYISIHKSVLDEAKHVPHENVRLAESKLVQNQFSE